MAHSSGRDFSGRRKMIEKSLRKWLRPVVDRRKKLFLLRRLAICWSIAALAGAALITANRLWGFYSPMAIWGLFISTGLASIIAWYKSAHIEPDYKAIARTIEMNHPDLKATLLTAIEQEPEEAFGQLDYLQERVIGEALAHAKDHDWAQSISHKTLVLARSGQVAALLFLIFVLSQLLPSSSFFITINTNAPENKDYVISVNPGDTTVESGSAVVITARFDEKLPQEVKLLIGKSQEDTQEIQLKRSLEDPVFGGIIPEVASDMIYYIEYANRRTRDYKITIYEHPMLERADAKIVYPAYTNLPDKFIKDTLQIGVVEGSQVTLTFTLNKTVKTARLVSKEGTAFDLTMDTEYPNVFTTSLSPKESQRYELKLVDAQGLSNKVPPRFIIDVHKNIPPDLRTTFPNRDLEASPLEELTFEAEVSDDYGVTARGINYTLAGTESKDVSLGQTAQPNKKQTIEYLLELEKLNAQPDQLLTYSFWAEDVGPDGNIRRTSSDLYFTEVRPFEEIFRESQSFQDQNNQQQNQQQGQQSGIRGEQLIELQKQIISATWNIKRQADQSASMDKHKEDLDLVRQSQSDALEQAHSASSEAEDPTAAQTLQEASKHMETSLEHLTKAGETASASELTPALGAEQSAYQELLKLRERESNVARSRNAQAQNSSRSARSREQLQQLDLRQREDRYETQRLAQSQQPETQRQDVQVLNRLRELARRQNEMTNRLRETEAALRQAQTEEQRQEISRELKRLRDQQIETLRDMDELQQRMEEPQNRQRMADASEQLNETRSRIQQSAEELQQGMVSNAATSTTRAQRELEQMRDEFQRRTSGQFSEQMRNMREQAQQLDERQNQISDDMKQQAEPEQKSLTETDSNRQLTQSIDEQRKRLQELLDQMKDVSEQSENSEPLLSRRLYDTLRQANTENVDRALQATGEALRRNFLPQAQEIERQARQGIENLRQGVEEAARGVLGDEAESLRLAQQQLDDLIRQINEEAARAGEPNQQQNMQASAGSRGRPADPNQLQNMLARGGARDGQGEPNQIENMIARGDRTGQPGDPNQSGRMQARSGTRGGQGDPNREQNMQARGGMRGGQDDPNQSGRMQARGGQGQRQNLQQTNRLRGGRANPNGLGGFRPFTDSEQYDPNGPLTGRNFTQWSDRLRDVEEMLSEQELREEVATVRDRARAMRSEFTRHGTEPQWDTVEMEITKPLTEVRSRVEEELAKLASKKALVPIDRDPVPSRYADLVRSYYENLGGGD
jgi:hypothetical protein